MTVGSNSNVAEHGMAVEEGRARIDRLDLQTGKLEPYATGLRNPNGMGWEPKQVPYGWQSMNVMKLAVTLCRIT